MKEIEGIVCVAEIVDPVKQSLLFGPNINGVNFSCERFTTNGLTPFSLKKDAEKALEELEGKKEVFGFVSVGLAKIELVITDSDEEIELIKDRDNFIIVAEIDDGEYLLLGKKVDSVPGVCYASVSELELNDFQVMTDIEEAGPQTLGALYEVRRQGRPVNSYLGIFKLSRLE